MLSLSLTFLKTKLLNYLETKLSDLLLIVLVFIKPNSELRPEYKISINFQRKPNLLVVSQNCIFFPLIPLPIKNYK